MEKSCGFYCVYSYFIIATRIAPHNGPSTYILEYILEENIFQSVSPRCDMVKRASVLQSQRSSHARSLDDNVGT